MNTTLNNKEVAKELELKSYDLSSDLVSKTSKTKAKIAPKALGEALAAKAKTKKITAVVFDRGGYRYTGRVKALADGARAGGLIF